MKTPTEVDSLTLECTCEDIRIYKWESLMENHTRANHRIIDKLVKKHLPDLYYDIGLNFPNPYYYHKTKTHLILVHSSIEYFLKFTN